MRTLSLALALVLTATSPRAPNRRDRWCRTLPRGSSSLLFEGASASARGGRSRAGAPSRLQDQPVGLRLHPEDADAVLQQFRQHEPLEAAMRASITFGRHLHRVRT